MSKMNVRILQNSGNSGKRKKREREREREREKAAAMAPRAFELTRVTERRQTTWSGEVMSMNIMRSKTSSFVSHLRCFMPLRCPCRKPKQYNDALVTNRLL